MILFYFFNHTLREFYKIIDFHFLFILQYQKDYKT